MQSFKEFLTESQGSPGSSTVFEQYIVDALNTLSVNPKAPAKFTSPELKDDMAHGVYASIAFAIAKDVQRAFPKHTTFIHAGHLRPTISAQYREYGGTDKTSKSDILSSDHKYALSLKESGGSALFSGSQGDTRAMFKFALDAYRATGAVPHINTLERIIEQSMSEITPPKGIDISKYVDIKHATGTHDGKPGFLDAAQNPRLLSKMPPGIQKFLKKLSLRDEDIKGKIATQLTTAMNADSTFRQLFVYECASGSGKFGSSKSLGAANAFLVWDKRRGLGRIEPFPSYKAHVIQAYAEGVRFRLRWKHGSKVRMSGDVSKQLTQFESARPQTYTQMLHEEFSALVLTEGVFDTLSTWWSSFTAWLQRFVHRVVDVLKHLATLGWNALIDFFELDIDSVQSTNPIIQ